MEKRKYKVRTKAIFLEYWDVIATSPEEAIEECLEGIAGNDWSRASHVSNEYLDTIEDSAVILPVRGLGKKRE